MLTLWPIGLLAITGVVIAISVTNVVRSAQNDTQPITSAEARVAQISGRNTNMLTGLLGGGNSYFHSVSREYYVTFDLSPEGKSVKFTIPIVEYPDIEKGDTGTLTFQGTRLISFE